MKLQGISVKELERIFDSPWEQSPQVQLLVKRVGQEFYSQQPFKRAAEFWQASCKVTEQEKLEV